MRRIVQWTTAGCDSLKLNRAPEVTRAENVSDIGIAKAYIERSWLNRFTAARPLGAMILCVRKQGGSI